MYSAVSLKSIQYCPVRWLWRPKQVLKEELAAKLFEFTSLLYLYLYLYLYLHLNIHIEYCPIEATVGPRGGVDRRPRSQYFKPQNRAGSLQSISYEQHNPKFNYQINPVGGGFFPDLLFLLI